MDATRLPFMAVITPTQAATSIQLTLINTPDGAVLIRADGELGADTGAARVATSLCRFADGLFDNGQPVRLAPEVVDKVL